MPQQNNSFSPSITQIISHRPNWIVRNGILLFLLIIVALIAATFFISYPDIVNAQAKLVSINAPKEVKTKTDGKLVKLFVSEGNIVQQGELLGFIESRANHHEVILLAGWIDTMQAIIESDYAGEIANATLGSYKNLGELQPAFQTFVQSFNLFNQYLTNGYFIKKKNMLMADMGYFKKLHNNLLQQKIMQQEDVGLAKQTLDANKTLDADKVISAYDYRNEKSKYIGKALSIPQINAAIINNQSSQHEKQKEIAFLENETAQQKEIFTQSLYTLKAQLQEWKNNYFLVAPVQGSIAFAGFLQENQYLQNNQTICFINPQNTTYFAEILIPQNNFGKIKTGQKVLLKLPAYAYAEFGAITGRLDFIANIPTDSGYLAKVNLPNGLQTNYKKNIPYHEGLIALGEIITADSKLSHRIFYQLRNLLSKGR